MKKRKFRTDKKLFSVLLALMFLLSFLPVRAGAAAETFSCRPAEEWNRLFDRRGRVASSWLAADGIYSVATGNGKTTFIFSDTLIGQSDLKGKTKGAQMANHSAAVLEGKLPDPARITFYYGEKGLRRDAGNLFGGRYWLFDCVYLNGTLFLLAFEPSETWKPLNVRVVSVPVVNGTPVFSACTVGGPDARLCFWSADGAYCCAFGQGITDCSEEDGYVYIYGFKDPIDHFESRDLIVARIPAADFGDFSKLRYWNGAGWGTQIEDCADIAENVSCEMSCTKLESGAFRGRYLLVYMHACNSGRLMYALGDSPVGPFDPPVEFYVAPEKDRPAANGNDTLYTYNAKAHPAFSSGGRILVSYNVNSSGEQYTVDYHPRFLYLTLGAEEDAVSPANRILQRLFRFWQAFAGVFLRFSSRH